MADSLAAIREELSLANRILAHEGIVDAFGHISVRHPTDPGRFLISRHRAPELVAPRGHPRIHARHRAGASDHVGATTASG